MAYQENSKLEENHTNIENQNNSEELNDQFCPYLGLKFDPKSWVGYPSPINYCHRVKPLAVPKFEHQRNFCLTKNFIECPIVYGGPGQKMPKTIQSQSNQNNKLKKIIRIEVITGFILIAIILSAIFWNQIISGISQISRLAPENSGTSTPSPGMTFTQSPTLTISPTFTPTATQQKSPTPTQTPIPPSETPSPPTSTIEPPILALETPMGPDKEFIIHAVIPGESLELYARDYNTTVEAIRAINSNLPSFLPLDWIVVIPLNTSDVSGFPAFEPYEIKQDVTLEVLADLLSVDPIDLQVYNRIPSGYSLSPGEWIIVPRE
jgi:hypothetical protein